MSGAEQIVIDLSNVPLKPIGKKEIQQLEMALIIGTLYRPEVLELIRDPVERATWIDSLAVAAAAFARYKAGIPVSEIAEELGRSEVTIRSHLNQKTKAGKLVAETYDKLRRGELKITVPFTGTQILVTSPEVENMRAELERLREEQKALEERVRALQEELERKSRELESLQAELKKRDEELQAITSQLTREKEKSEKLRFRLNELVEQVKHIKQLAHEIISITSKLLE